MTKNTYKYTLLVDANSVDEADAIVAAILHGSGTERTFANEVNGVAVRIEGGFVGAVI